MTAAQKMAKAKFKQAIAYRQKTGVSLKEAFAHIYGKKKIGVVKKKNAKKVGKIDPNKAFKKQMQVNKIINTKYKDYEYPVPPVYTGNWSVLNWSNWIKKNGRKIGAIKRKSAKKKPSEQSILNRIHKVKHDVERLDEAQHKHMSGIGSNTIKQIQNNLDQLVHLERKKLIYEDWKKEVKNVADKKRLNQMIKSVKDLIKEHKTHIIQLKKHIK
jgi:hypothetical protein